MPKREWDEAARYGKGNNNDAGHHSAIKRARVEGILTYGRKSMFQALKVARGFERQKLGRRQKQAKQKQDTEESARLEAEVAAIKGLDLAIAAQQHLTKTLAKIKLIADSAAFPKYIIAKAETYNSPPTTAIANVTARLYNSNPVKEVISEIIEAVHECLDLEKGPTLPKKKRLRAADYKSKDGGEKLALQERPQEEKTSKAISFEEPSTSSFEATLISPGGEAGSGTIDGHRPYVPRLANDSNYDESAYSDEENTRYGQHLSFSHVRSPPPKEPPPKTTKTSKMTTGVKSTTFLPSLTVGGYLSNSDSDPSDIDSAVGSKPRKNRMGQQARRQLWEKKYGQSANHLRKESRDQDWDARKGAQGGDQRGSKRRRLKWGRGKEDRGRGRSLSNRSGGRGVSGANSDPLGKRPVRETNADSPLHPSWEAAKRKKEVKRSVAFEGKKIVFD